MKKPKVLVTGGSGYIGSHTIVDLLEKGFEVIAVDNFDNAHQWINDRIVKITRKKALFHFYEIDICKNKKLKKVFDKHKDIQGIIHFAAHKAVGESVENPLKYYSNNLIGLTNVLKCAKKYNVKNFIFSSSCTVYGNVEHLPVTEDTPQQPAESPYGATKVMGERIIEDFIKANPKHTAVLLRYFNPAGAHPSGLIGELPQNKPQNLVPIITAVAAGKMAKLTVFGNDYDTRDGSCIRDYIHVCDLAEAHTLALNQAIKAALTSNCEAFNLGIGQGITVMEAIAAFEKTTQQKLNYEIGQRRAGDVIAIYADYSKAKSILGWQPKFGIEEIMATAWNWEKSIN